MFKEDGIKMKNVSAGVVLVVGLISSAASAKDHFYQKGKLVSMEAVSCGYAEKSGKTFVGENTKVDPFVGAVIASEKIPIGW